MFFLINVCVSRLGCFLLVYLFRQGFVLSVSLPSPPPPAHPPLSVIPDRNKHLLSLHLSLPPPPTPLLRVFGVTVFFLQDDFSHHGLTPFFCNVLPLQLLPHLALPLHSPQEAAPPCPRRGLRPHLLDTNAPCPTLPARSLTVRTVKGA